MQPKTQIGQTMWRVKTRLQFTGWLQYIPNAVAMLICYGGALVGWAIGVAPALLFWPPFILGSGLLLVLLADLCIIKLGLRPPEPLPRRRDDLDAFELMRARTSCRAFQPRDLTPEHRAELMGWVDLHSQPSRLMGEHPIRFEYVAAPLTVWPVVGAREFLVAIAPSTYNRRAVIDVGRSLQRIVIEATRMGLGTCWIGPGADQDSIERYLGTRFDPARNHIICVCAVGYASRFVPLTLRLIQRSQRRRLPLSSLFFADANFREPLDTQAAPFAHFGRCFEVCRWSPSSFNGQTTRCAAVVDATQVDAHAMRLDFAAATGSRFYAPVALGIWCANWEIGCEALAIPGRLSVLPADERGLEQVPDLPRYDVSWVMDPAGYQRLSTSR